MNTKNTFVELNIEELKIPYGDGGVFKGKLFGATPNREKPHDMSAETWAISLLTLTTRIKEKYTLAVPVSFWPSIEICRAQKSEPNGVHWITVMDQIEDISKQHGATPERSFHQIIDALKSGKNVLILSATGKISGFVPAIMSLLLHPTAHVEKVAYPIIEGLGYEMTPFQLGYLYGFSGSGSITI